MYQSSMFQLWQASDPLPTSTQTQVDLWKGGLGTRYLERQIGLWWRSGRRWSAGLVDLGWNSPRFQTEKQCSSKTKDKHVIFQASRIIVRSLSFLWAMLLRTAGKRWLSWFKRFKNPWTLGALTNLAPHMESLENRRGIRPNICQSGRDDST
jgi:hypothetical protein